MLQSAHAVVRSATEFLQGHFGPCFSSGISVGIMGSFARNGLCAVSDIDYYVVFDLTALSECGIQLDATKMLQVIDDTVLHVRQAYPEQALARRFSVFWTTLECLEKGDYGIGRWTPYDREAFRREGVYFAGKLVVKGALPRVPWPSIITDSARFFLEVLLAKLESVRFFHRVAEPEAPDLGDIGEVALVKSVLMPVRLLYVLLPVSADCPIADTEAAIAACSEVYRGEPWWPLVNVALKWRKCPPMDEPELRRAALLLRSHLTELYVFCLNQYADAMRERHEVAIAARLVDWRMALLKLGAANEQT
jgi:hypothetical protein